MTKHNILNVSKKLFLENGIANVRLQQIADEAHISVGNLAYHFKNKEAIVEALYEEVFAEMYKLLDTLVDPSSLPDFDKTIRAIFRFNNNFPFCFNNVWEISRNYPGVQKLWLDCCKKMLIQIHKFLTGFLKNNILEKEPFDGSYKLLAKQIQLNFICWTQHQQLNSRAYSLKTFKQSNWSLIYPYFTKKGIQEYQYLNKKKMLAE